MLERCLTTWLRPALTLMSLAGILSLTACGGGNGAPNNPYAPGATVPSTLVVLPVTSNVYSNTPATLSISGGTPPYQAFSNNSTVLPVTQNVSGNTIVLLPATVAADTTVGITVRDSGSQAAVATVVVHAAPLLNTLKVTPSGADCGTNVCSGQTAQVTVSALGPAGGGIAGRQIRFDVVSGPYGILTNNPAAPLAQTLTVVTDSTGLAQVQIRANADATTQTAQIRATDLTAGQQQTAYFVIQQNTVAGGSPLAVVPDTATITTQYNDACSSGFQIDYYIYGGTPPYRVASTFPAAVTLINPTVTASGGYFTAITNGTCVNPLTFTIVDAAGKQVQATLINQAGKDSRPTPPVVAPPALVATPTTQDVALCGGKSPLVLVTGGTPPYNMASVTTPPVLPAQTPTITPQTLGTSGTFQVVFPVSFPGGATKTSVVIQDSSSPTKTVTAVINCS